MDEDYSAISYQEANELFATIESSKSIIGVLFLIILVLSGSTIMNTMLMSVFERTKEIGMMKSMGMKNLKIINLFMLESTFMGIFAGLAGGAFGAAVSIYFTKAGINFGKFIENIDMPIKSIVYFQFKMEYFTFALVFGIIVAIVSALYPSFKVTRMQPTEAMRAE
ncbi:Macrolide export ATP-binding/permease protein MacB [subsurface metagenome]